LLAAKEKNYDIAYDGRAKIWVSDDFEYLDDTKTGAGRLYLRCRYRRSRKCPGRAKLVPKTDMVMITKDHSCHVWMNE
jgi:hypothetical protein